jgi:pseudaminic acid biosynthesis-associated methylase
MTSPVDVWSGPFGADYTDRNPQTPEELDIHYRTTFGISRSDLNHEFLNDLDRDIRILEVGSNVGTQLRMLERMSFTHLTGLELQSYALSAARGYSPELPFVRGEGSRLPFVDESFDLVFTSGVLIHIDPLKLPGILAEIHRCTRRYIWGWEYFSEAYCEVVYRERGGMLWKGDFAAMYRERFPNLQMLRERRVPYLNGPNEDSMFLLEKRAGR